MILKIYGEDGYMIYDNLSRVSVKDCIEHGTEYFKKMSEYATLIVNPGEPQTSDAVLYRQIFARSKIEGDMIFLVNTIAYLCNDSGKTVETIRPKKSNK